MHIYRWVIFSTLACANVALAQGEGFSIELEEEINSEKYFATEDVSDEDCAEMNKILTQKLQDDAKNFQNALARGIEVLVPFRNENILTDDELAIMEKAEKRIKKFSSEGEYEAKDGKTYPSYAAYKAAKASAGAQSCVEENAAIREEYQRLLDQSEESPGTLIELAWDLEDIAEGLLADYSGDNSEGSDDNG